MNFNNRVTNFMKGRYGIDDLYKFLFYVYIIIFIINIFVKSKIIDFIEVMIVVIMFYRFFSKKIYVRSNENQKFLQIKRTLIKPFNNIRRNIRDRKHVYKKCHKCKTVLKLPLPSKRGFNTAKCPHCKNSVRLFTLKKEKIEIIKNKK